MCAEEELFDMENEIVTLETACGSLRGLQTPECRRFLGVPYAHAERFSYARLSEHWDGVLDATRFGDACPQNRAVHEHLENPTRRFYKREFRDGIHFTYGEDCLNLNIYAPVGASGCPVLLFFHGGGFDSGMNCEGAFDGTGLARRGVVTVFANYRVGPLGYLTHPDVERQFGRDGNFGLDDMLCALRWVKSHIADFGGDETNITLAGHSAGAISVQYLCLNPAHTGLFRRALMLSGAGLFPKFALPRRAEDTHEYWADFLRAAQCGSLEELRRAPLDTLFDAVETLKRQRKDNTYNTMPVVDGLLLPAAVDELMKTPLPIPYLLGYTNNDLYAPLMAYIGNRFAKDNGAYVYFFDLDAPGDENGAFHSCDLRYLFETLDGSWRPYGQRDREAAAQLASYAANFARCGDPNGDGLPRWNPAGRGASALRFAPGGTAMGRASYLALTRNLLKRGEPKA